MKRDFRSARNMSGHQLVIDGTAEDGTLQGDGQDAPFYVFNVDRQCNVAGPYDDLLAAGWGLIAKSLEY